MRTYIVQLSLIIGLQHEPEMNMREVCPLPKRKLKCRFNCWMKRLLIIHQKKKKKIKVWVEKSMWSCNESWVLTFLAAVLNASLWLISGLLALILWISSLQRKEVLSYMRNEEGIWILNIYIYRMLLLQQRIKKISNRIDGRFVTL